MVSHHMDSTISKRKVVQMTATMKLSHLAVLPDLLDQPSQGVEQLGLHSWSYVTPIGVQVFCNLYKRGVMNSNSRIKYSNSYCR